ARVAELTVLLEDLRQQRDTAHAGLTESKVALATEEQMCASFQQQQQALEQRRRELTQVIEQRRNDLGSFVTRKQQAELEIQESRAKIETLQHQREQVNAQAGELLAQQQSQESDIRGREESLREERRRLADTQQQRGALEVELAQKEMSVQNLRERVEQKYHVRLDDVRSECITITFAEEGRAQVHVMTPEEMAACGAATDWAAVAQEVGAPHAAISSGVITWTWAQKK